MFKMLRRWCAPVLAVLLLAQLALSAAAAVDEPLSAKANAHKSHKSSGTVSTLSTLPLTNAPGAWCTPYGPRPGYQYDPATLMSLLGQPRDEQRGPFLSAHRGAWNNEIPENSIMAINHAAELKFEMIELDVKMTQDEELILMHDYTLGRTTQFAKDVHDYDNWDPFLAQTTYNNFIYRPQDYADWNTLSYYNPVIADVNWDATEPKPQLRAFDKSSGSLGQINGAQAVGRWVEDQTFGPPPTLLEALQHIGTYYPGMTVVIDLRHLDEVIETLNIIDQVYSCEGTPAKEWVILKPFANVFKDGWYNAHSPDADEPGSNSVISLIGQRAWDYKWIPVISNRLVSCATTGNPTCNNAGQPSIIPSSPGPDISQITVDPQAYLEDWGLHQNIPSRPIVTMEIGYNPQSLPSIASAYAWATQYATNMQSWRPPDINVSNQVTDPSNGRVIIGFNWKDDGLGVYPVHQGLFRPYADTRATAGAITVDDTWNVLNQWESASDREAAMMAIAKPIPFSNYTHFRLTAKHSGKSLIIPNNAQTLNTQATQHAGKGDNQRWRFEALGDGQYRIISMVSGKVLDVSNGGTAENTQVLQWSWKNSDNQRWKVEMNGDNTYRIVSVETGKVLQVLNGSTSNGASVVTGTWSNQGRQKWQLVNAGFGHTLVRNVGSGKVLDLPGSTMDNVNLVQWDQSDDFNQRFLVSPYGSTAYYQFIALHSYKRLDILDASTLNSAAVVQWDLTYNDSQLWQIEPQGDGTYRIVNIHSGKAMDVANGSNDNHAPVIQYDWNGNDNQRWYIEPML